MINSLHEQNPDGRHLEMISFTHMTLTKQSVNSRISRSDVFCEKRVFKFFANTYAGASFLIKLQGSTLLKKETQSKRYSWTGFSM